MPVCLPSVGCPGRPYCSLSCAPALDCCPSDNGARETLHLFCSTHLLDALQTPQWRCLLQRPAESSLAAIQHVSVIRISFFKNFLVHGENSKFHEISEQIWTKKWIFQWSKQNVISVTIEITEISWISWNFGWNFVYRLWSLKTLDTGERSTVNCWMRKQNNPCTYRISHPNVFMYALA